MDLSYELRARVAIEGGGFRTAHSLGQNFILNEVLLNALLDAAGVGAGDRVLEIGPGAGVMTALLSDRCEKVVSIEIDEKLRPVLAEVLRGKQNVELLFADALRVDLHRLALEQFGGEPFRVVANLPYYITSEILTRLVATRLPVTDICVMVQKEAAERILSRPGTKQWCALSAAIAYFGSPEILADVPRTSFTPPPHVDSAFLRIAVYPERPHQARSDEMMLKVIHAAFLMRRKKLANNLKAAFALPPADVSSVLAAAGIDPDVRGEVLEIAELSRLSDAILARKTQPTFVSPEA